MGIHFGIQSLYSKSKQIIQERVYVADTKNTEDSPKPNHPKLFISYSWSSDAHVEWVVKLASELVDSGVEVILDKWDLSEGQDAITFMEKMVTDPEIKKVIMICDKTYAEKTDAKSGGVGTEAQIISPKIYAETDQNKFVAILKERDEGGEPYLPTYYQSRVYIDLSDPANYSQNFEQLLRWIYDKPLYIKPEVGEPPAYLDDNANPIRLRTTPLYRRAINSITDGKDTADGAIEEYLTSLAGELEKFRIDHDGDQMPKYVRENIEAFIPYRNEAIQVFNAISLYRDTDTCRQSIQRFFEAILPYQEKPEGVVSHRRWDFDNFRFIVHELFLYLISFFISREKFPSAEYFLASPYYLPGRTDHGNDAMVTYVEFRHHMSSLSGEDEQHQKVPGFHRASLLRERCNDSILPFKALMQSDFVLFLRQHLLNIDTFSYWWPETLVFTDHFPRPFEVFSRSSSNKYFSTVQQLIGANSKDHIEQVLEEFESGERQLPKWGYNKLQVRQLLNFDRLCSIE